jgi:hypothetical protein
MRGLLSLPGGSLLDYRPTFANQPVQPFHFGGGSDEGSIVCLRGPLTKDAPGSVSTAGEKIS